MQMNMTRTQNDFSDREHEDILPQFRFLDPGGQFAPSFAWISKKP